MNLQLKSRQVDILKCLIASATPVSVNMLIEKYNKSERSIRYDINTIRDEIIKYDIEIKAKPKKGFYIPATQKQKCSSLLGASQIVETSLLDDSEKTRYATLYLYFLIQRKRVTAINISDHFFVSKSTALRLIGNFEAHYKQQVQLSSQKVAGYLLVGDELNIRKIAVDILARLLKGSYSVEDWYILLPAVLKNGISLADLIRISNAIKKINTRHNVWISNDAFINLLSYCLIQELRWDYKNTNQTSKLTLENDELIENDYVTDLMQELTENKQVNQKENDWLLSILKDNGIIFKDQSNATFDLNSIIDEMINILNRKQSQYPYEFDTATLHCDLYEHLHHSNLQETQAHIQDVNPLLSEIKSKYTPFFNLAQECAQAFDHQAHLTLSESEISYVAIYLYKNLVNSNSNNKKVLVVCATGKGLSNLLTTRIKHVFQDLTIVGQVSPYQVDRTHQYQDIDFVISTIPLPECLYPVVKISRILSVEDIQRIHEFLHYGKFIDNIPFNQNHAASFNAKTDLFDLLSVNTDEKKINLAESTVIVSKLIMTLLEYTSKFPVDSQMNQDSILGLMIHLILAIPRWYAPSNEHEEDVMESYLDFKHNHNKVFILMEKFFALVEEALLISISIPERYAFFLYIINDEEGDYE